MDRQKEHFLREFVNNHIVYNISMLVTEHLQEEVMGELENPPEIEDENGELTGDEIFEYWLVSDWLWERLREKGEPVAEVSNLLIWGRTCTGQAILLDSVIEEIYDDWQARFKELTS